MSSRDDGTATGWRHAVGTERCNFNSGKGCHTCRVRKVERQEEAKREKQKLLRHGVCTSCAEIVLTQR